MSYAITFITIQAKRENAAVILTTWHLLFATIITQIMAYTTTLLDARNAVEMTPRVYMRAIVPIGLLYSGSLVCSNVVYLYLNVSFVQMIKVSLRPLSPHTI